MAVSVSTHSLELISQDIANNSSVVRYLVKITTTGASHNDNNITTTYHVDGVTYTKTHKLPTKSTTTVADKTVTITHNPDGSRSVSANFSTPTGISAGTLTGSKTLTLPTIPRASAIGVADANIGSSTTITINKPPNTNFTTAISYKSPQDSEWIPIVITTQDSYAWTVPTRLYAMIPNDPTIQCQFQAETISDGQTIGTTTTTATFRATTPPLINSFTLQDINSTTTALTGDSSKMIKYASTVRASVNSVGQNSATISYNKVNGVETSGGKVDFANATTNSYSLEVKDSRDNFAYDEKTMTMINYIPLTITATAKRHTATDGNVDISVSGNYWTGNFGSQNNTLTVQYRYAENGGSWSNWTNLTTTVSGTTYSGSTQVSDIDYQKIYYFQFKAIDKIQEKPVNNITVPKGEPIYYWDDDEFGVVGLLKYGKTGRSDYSQYGFDYDMYGNMQHKSTGASTDSWSMSKKNGDKVLRIYPETGSTELTGELKINGFPVLMPKSISSGVTSYKNITDVGIYSISAQLNDTPDQYGTLIVIPRGDSSVSSYRFYIYINYDARMWISVYWGGTWYAWVQH